MGMVKGIFRVRNAREKRERKEKKKKEKLICKAINEMPKKYSLDRFQKQWIQLRLFNLHLVWKKLAATWIILTTNLTTVNRGFLRTVSLHFSFKLSSIRKGKAIVLFRV